MMRSAAFVKIIAVYGHIDENGRFVRKWSSRKMAITDKMVKNNYLSVNFSEILADCPKNKKYPTIIRILCLTIIGHFIMARIFIIIQLRTGS